MLFNKKTFIFAAISFCIIQGLQWVLPMPGHADEISQEKSSETYQPDTHLCDSHLSSQSGIEMIYVHGVLNRDITSFMDGAEKLHKSFMKLKFKDEKVSCKFYTLYWGDLPVKDAGYSNFENSIGTINSTNNYLIKGFEPKLNPSTALVANFTDKGSTLPASMLRSWFANFLHDEFWLLKYNSGSTPNMARLEDNLQSIAKAISGSGHDFILAGHSAGSTIVYRYVSDRIANNGDQDIRNHFIGMITFGSPITTIYPSEFSNGSDSAIVKFFRDNALFWINVSNRNDIIASGLPQIVQVSLPSDKGFIKDVVTKGITPLGDYLSSAHDWYFSHDTEFTRLIDKTYQESSSHLASTY